MRKTLIGIGMYYLLFLCTPVRAEPVTIITIGSSTCGEWTAERSQQTQQSIADTYWLVGFVSGAALGTEKNFSQGLNRPALAAWVDNYCRANPLDRVATAATQLVGELRKRYESR